MLKVTPLIRELLHIAMTGCPRLSKAVQDSCSAFASDPRFHLLGAVSCIQQNVPVERHAATALQVAHHLHKYRESLKLEQYLSGSKLF